MNTRDIYINAKATSPKSALVRSAVTTTPIRMSDLVVADTVDFRIWLVDGDGGVHADSGSENIGVRVGVGMPGELPSAGTFTIAYGLYTSLEIPYNATAAQIVTAMDDIIGIAPADLVVTGEPGAWLIEFVGNLLGTNVTDLAVGNNSLYPDSWLAVDVIQQGGSGLNEIVFVHYARRPLAYVAGAASGSDYWTAQLSLNTASLYERIGTNASEELMFEVELEATGNKVRTVLQVPVMVINDVLTEFSTVEPLSLSSVLSTTDIEEQFVQNRATVDGLTGGGDALDGVATVALNVGISAVIPANGYDYTYRLTAGTTAESSPNVIRPDDYAGTTNEKVWVLQSIRAANIRADYVQIGLAAPDVVNPAVALTRTVAGASANARGYTDNSDFTQSNYAYASYDARPTLDGANFEHIAGFQSRPIIDISGTVDKVYGFISYTEHEGGTVADYYAFYGAATVGATRKWGLYAMDANASNYMAGRCGIGINTFPTSAGTLLALGNVTTAPTDAPASGGVLFVEAGALKYIGSDGTVTTLADA